MREEDDQLYIYKLYGLSRPRRIKASNVLRSLIGAGTKITDEQISKAQDVIDHPDIDFEPYVMEYLLKIRDGIDLARYETYLREDEYNMIIVPLTQIKGQAGMFGNELVSEVSSLVLEFLELYHTLDDDVLSILDSYCHTVRLSYDQDIKSSQTSGGRNLLNELEQAMERYKVKFNKRVGR